MMKRSLLSLFALTLVLATVAHGIELKRAMARKTAVTAAPSTATVKTRIFGLHSTAQSSEMVKLADDSVPTFGGVNVPQRQYESQALQLYQPASAGTHSITIKPKANLATDVTVEIGDEGIVAGVSPATYQADQIAINTQLAVLNSRIAALQAAMVASGTPLVAGIAASPTSLAFGSVDVGNTGTLSTTLSNTGQANLTIGNADKAGTNPGYFTIGTDTCSGTTLVPGATCGMTVIFTPDAVVTSYSAQLTVPHSAGSALNIALTGNIPVANTSVFYQQATSTTSTLVGNLSDRTYVGSRFTITGGMYLTMVQPKLYRIAGTQPGTLTMQIYRDNAGVPGALVATSTNTHSTDIATGTTYASAQYYDFSFSAEALTAGDYWAVLKASAIDSVYYYGWANTGFGSYPMKKSADGTTWVSVGTNQSNTFKVWGY